MAVIANLWLEPSQNTNFLFVSWVPLKILNHRLRTPNKFWGIQHPFCYSESLVHVFYNSTIIKTKPIWDWDLNFGRKELGI